MQNYNIDMKIDQHKHNKENNLLQSRLRVAENTSKPLVKNHHKHTEKIIDLERDLHGTKFSARMHRNS